MLLLASCSESDLPQANTPPTVELTTDGPLALGTPPVTATFAAVASDADGDVLTYAWNLDDTVTTPTLTYTFPQDGNFPVTVTVSDGQAEATDTVTVSVATFEPPPETPPGDGVPVINNFSADPAVINAGESATLTWDVTNAQTLTISPDVGDVSSETSVTVSPTVTTTYILTAVTADEEYTAATTVTVQ
jgi:hypothetical protein